MNTTLALACLCAALAVLPLGIAVANLRRGKAGFDRPTDAADPGTAVSILIPARNEAHHIRETVARALATRGVTVEVVVLDDQSSDDTAGIVQRMAAEDRRVRLVRSGALPDGWAGKQFACWQLAGAAAHDVLMFIDADVRLEADAATRAAAALLGDARRGLVSGFPREVTGSLAERLVVPWIHVLLLGYLPMARMRASRDPAFAAGCGQWMVARRAAYRESQGHAAAPWSRHDGLSLPRAFRKAGWDTDLFDGTDLATCRMYGDAASVRHGFGKSAGEGMATPVAIVVWTVLLVPGHILPWALLVASAFAPSLPLALASGVGVAANLALRMLLAKRLAQRPVDALLHPLGACCVLVIQWQATVRHVLGRTSSWKGRRYATGRAGPDPIGDGSP